MNGFLKNLPLQLEQNPSNPSLLGYSRYLSNLFCQIFQKFHSLHEISGLAVCRTLPYRFVKIEAMSKFIQADPKQPLLLPIDLREWIPADDMVHFILEAVEQIELQHFKVNTRGSGSRQYHPRMMLALLTYCYANGIFGSRRIEAATYRDIGVRYLCADTHPDHDTICKFRRENFVAVSAAFLQILQLAQELKILKVGRISVDGTKLDANASKHRNVRYDRAGVLIEQLEADIGELMAEAEQADRQEHDTGQQLPENLARREQLKRKLAQARARLEQQAKARAKRERAEYERKLKAREQRVGKHKGKKPKPPNDLPPPNEQTNLTDPDSRLMRKNKGSEYRQSYNAQAAVSTDGSQMILGNRISACASDRNELVADVESVPEALGRISGVLADSGYGNGREVEELERRSIEVLAATGQGKPRTYDFRPAKAPPPPPKQSQSQPWVKRMKARLESDRGRSLYRLRQQTVEPVFGIIKAVMGFRHFQLRGQTKVEGEWELVCLAYNCKRLHRLMQTV
jgi:transposase